LLFKTHASDKYTQKYGSHQYLFTFQFCLFVKVSYYSEPFLKQHLFPNNWTTIDNILNLYGMQFRR